MHTKTKIYWKNKTKLKILNGNKCAHKNQNRFDELYRTNQILN